MTSLYLFHFRIRNCMTFDHLQAIFWSLTYIVLIFYAVKYRAHAIPLIAVCLNFAWETLALIGSIMLGRFSSALYIHISWFTLDLVMVLLYLFHETKIHENKVEKCRFLVAYLLFAACLAGMFLSGYMLESCFIIDFIMAVSFVLFIVYERSPKSRLLYLIGILKLLGDLFAWQYYKNKDFVNLIGICVLLCNIGYMLILLKKDFPKHSGA